MKLKKKFKIEGMHCSSCAITIDMDLEDLDGVGKAETSYAKSEVEVEFDGEKLDQQKIIDIIQKSGYAAVPVEF